MRKALSLFFLSVILLNTAGYYLVYEGWKWHSEQSFSFNDDHATSEEVIIELPVSVPYNTQVKEWEKADGQFEYKGETYRIVKQKLTPDAVYVACVKDQQTTRIHQEQSDFAKTFSDKQEDGKPSLKSFPGFIKDYISSVISVKPSVSGWSLEVAYVLPTNSFIPSFTSSIVQPPESIA